MIVRGQDNVWMIVGGQDNVWMIVGGQDNVADEKADPEWRHLTDVIPYEDCP